MFGTLLYDFIRDFFTWLYDRMGKVYDNIAKAVWKGVEEDLASETDLQAAREAAANAIREDLERLSAVVGNRPRFEQNGW